MPRPTLVGIGYFKDGPNRKCEEENDFHWLGETRGGECGPLSLRLTSHPASGSRFVLHTSASGLPWSTLLRRLAVLPVPRDGLGWGERQLR